MNALRITPLDGAIVGTYRDEAMFQQLTTQLATIGSRVIKPQIN